MAKIDAAYVYLLTTYGKPTGSRYDSHDESELKDLCNNIIQINKDAPLYRIKRNPDITSFAIDVKEHARKIRNVIASISDDGDDIASMLQKRVAISSDEDVVSVRYVGKKDNTSEASGFDIEVKQLATPQENDGFYLKRRGRSFEEGTFSFDLNTPSNSYEFQFNVNPGDNNYDVQSKIVRLINHSDVGLDAEIRMNDNGESALCIRSKQTGLIEGEDSLFEIKSGSSWNEVSMLGITRITSPATNSVFLLNGNEHSALSNTFTIDHTLELTLRDTCEGETVHIGYQANMDTLAEGISEMLNAYNNMITVGQAYARSHGTHHLLDEMHSISRGLGSELESVGITADEQGKLSLDADTLTDAISGANTAEGYQTLNHFKSALYRQAYKASINPMEYVDKTIIAYKNPGGNFIAPYAPSAYAGMLVDQTL
jgi:flagellar hook-associated protein 2